jgi:hypothetical protein
VAHRLLNSIGKLNHIATEEGKNHG